MGRRPKAKDDGRQQHGVLVLDKPTGPTSADCLNRVKRELGQWRIGHAGTLDPLATGVLVVLLGHATKIAPYLGLIGEDGQGEGGDKTYLGRLRLGMTTDTYDIQGQILEERPWEHIAPSDVEAAVKSWEALTSQEVPAYSAAKHQGRPLYELAREGLEVPVKIKAVTIYSAEAVAIDLPEATFRVACSSGTYVRSLVHSLGKRLGCGATMTALTREASQPFTLAQAHGLEEVLADPEGFPDKVLPIEAALPGWPCFVLDERQAAGVKNGVRLPSASLPGSPRQGDRVLLKAPDGGPLALAEAVPADGTLVWSILRGLW